MTTQQAAALENESHATVDWDKAEMTDSARNVTPHDRLRMVLVHRNVFDQWCDRPWAEVEAAAFAGVVGLEPWLIRSVDRAPSNMAYVREGRTEHMLRGRMLLYSQGW